MTKKEIENTVMGDKIAAALGIESMTEIVESVVVPEEKSKPNIRTYSQGARVEITERKNVPDGSDFSDVQEAIRQIARMGAEKLHELGEVASASQHPRAYEAYTELMKAAVTAQKDLLEIQKLQNEITANKPVDGGRIVNNNLFVGTTSEMMGRLKQIEDQKDD